MLELNLIHVSKRGPRTQWPTLNLGMSVLYAMLRFIKQCYYRIDCIRHHHQAFRYVDKLWTRSYIAIKNHIYSYKLKRCVNRHGYCKIDKVCHGNFSSNFVLMLNSCLFTLTKWSLSTYTRINHVIIIKTYNPTEYRGMFISCCFGTFCLREMNWNYTYLSNYNHSFQWDVITYPYP